MTRPIISYINKYIGVNYSDIGDFLKDLSYNPPEYNVNYLSNFLLIIEEMEKEVIEEEVVVSYFSPFTDLPVMVETETHKYMIEVTKIIDKE